MLDCNNNLLDALLLGDCLCIDIYCVCCLLSLLFILPSLMSPIVPTLFKLIILLHIYVFLRFFLFLANCYSLEASCFLSIKKKILNFLSFFFNNKGDFSKNKKSQVVLAEHFYPSDESTPRVKQGKSSTALNVSYNDTTCCYWFIYDDARP